MAADISVVTVADLGDEAAIRFGTAIEAAQRSAGDPTVELFLVARTPEEKATAARVSERSAPAGIEPVLFDAGAGASRVAAANAAVDGTSGDVVVVADLDVTFHQRFFRILRREVTEPWDFLAPAIREGADKRPAGAAQRTRGHQLAPMDPPPRQSTAVEAGNAACVVVRRATLERRRATVGGLFDEMCRTDPALDLFWWAAQQRLIVRYVPDLMVGRSLGDASSGGLRSGEVAQRAREGMADFRVTVWKNASSVREWIGWPLGEGSLVAQAVTAHGVDGIRQYLRSWPESVRMAAAMRRDRGRVRPRRTGGDNR